MATSEEVKKLAKLARLKIEDSEVGTLAKEFDAILAYVGQLEKLELPEGNKDKSFLRNVMREDGAPHAPGAFTEKLASQFPTRQGDALSVKQIISHE